VKIEISGQEVKSLDFHPLQIAADVVVNDCYEQLRKDPGGAPFYDGTAIRVGCNVADLVGYGNAWELTPGFLGPPTCEAALCQTEALLCVSQRMMELSQATAPVTLSAMLDPTKLNADYVSHPTWSLRGAAAAKVTLPPPDAETSVGLREVAFHFATRAARLAGEDLRSMAGRTNAQLGAKCVAADVNKVFDGMLYGEAFASAMNEAITVASEAARGVAEGVVGVAEADYARIPDKSLASKLAWVSGTMSRARAAHVLIGGRLSQGLGNYRTTDQVGTVTASSAQAFCPSEPPSGTVAEALALLRLAAPNPYVATTLTLPFATMFEQSTGLGGAVIEPPLRARLAERLGDDSLNTTSAATFLSQRKLTEADFLSARTYMKDEIKAFARDPWVTLPPIPIASSATGERRTTTLPVYAATGSLPEAPPPLYYQVMARFPFDKTAACFDCNSTINEAYDNNNPFTRPNVETYGTSLASILDYGRMVASDVITTPGSLQPIAQDVLATYLGSEGGRVTGRLESCYRYTVPPGQAARDEMRIRVFGPPVTTPSDYALVSGVSGLRCAVNGSVEGAPCSLSTYALGASTIGGQLIAGPTASAVTDTFVGFPGMVEFRIVPPVSDPPAPIFVVRRRVGLPAAPGNYEGLGGFRPQIDHAFTSTSYQMCSLQPFHNETAVDAQTLLVPTTNSCGQAAMTCADTNVGDKLPLESELSEDHNGVESSWRVYLNRARAAAERTDQLGEQLIEQGLDMDRRIESSIEQLATLCGGEVSLGDFFPGDMSGYRSTTTCTNEGEICSTNTSQVCRNGRCIADPIAILKARAATDPAAARLIACLGDNSTTSVALGSKKMCMWKSSNGRVCEPVAGKECPFPSNAQNVCPVSYLPTGTTMVEAEPLKLFSPPDEGTNVDPDRPPACSEIRRLRQDTTMPAQERSAAIRRLNTGFFAPDKLNQLARRIGWEARPDDYSAITLDGTPVFETGSIFRSPAASMAWPCTSGPYPGAEAPGVGCTGAAGATEGRASLFCSYTSCANPSDRARRAAMNDRMGRAVLALRILGNAGLGPAFRGPFLPVKRYILETETDDFGTAPDLKSAYISWPQGNGPLSAPGRSVVSSSTLRYTTVDDDPYPNGDDVGYVDVTGLALCFNSEPSVTWTGGDPVVSQPARCSDTWFPMFKAYPPANGTNPGPRVGQFWMGLDGQTLPESDSGWSGLGRRMLLVRGGEDALVLPAFSPAAYELSGYWTDEPPMILSNGYSVMNTLKVAQDGLTERDMLDAMELACEVARTDTPGLVASDCAPAPGASALQDVDGVERFLRCTANGIRSRAEREVFIDMPVVVKQALLPGSQLEGELEAAAGDFAAALISFRNQELLLQSTLAAFAEDMKRLRIQLRQQQIAAELVNLNKLSTIANQTAACLSGVASTAKPENLVFGAWGAGISAAVVCANSAAQIGIALQTAGLQNENVQLEGDLTWVEYESKFRGYGETLQAAAIKLAADGASMRAALARIADKREAGRRELSKAMMLGTDSAGRHFAVNTVIRRRYNTLAVRYQRAWQDAIKLAWIARRAIEQRLGLPFNDMHDDMLLVEAPATWADELCTISGIDYTRIRQENGLDADDFADQYLGDYVNKLEMVVSSYEHDYPFHDGKDTAVISLRDDVTSARRTCDVPAPNLLAYSSHLEMTSDPETSTIVSYEANPDDTVPPPPIASAERLWTQRGCGGAVPCATIEVLDGAVVANRPITTASATGGEVLAHRISFPLVDGSTPPDGPVSSYNAGSVLGNQFLGQDVVLAPGYYRLSWYARVTASAPAMVAALVAADGDTLSRHPVASVPGNNGWNRYFTTYRVNASGVYTAGVRPATTQGAVVEVAALMLEDVTERLPGTPEVTTIDPATLRPVQYVATTRPGITQAAVCEDTRGDVFRTRFTRGCARLCPAGYGTCADGPLQCYWELPFDVNLEAIEGGRTLAQTGFAYGNYNYRVERFAINVVGTGIKDCSGSKLPTTCQANASVPFSLDHIGPFTVRNHKGEVFSAPLFEGRVEHGRGLAAERYLTNPISSADRALIEPYSHHELSGRPLTGRYRLRIWDADGVAFPHIEDVQVILDYRYWTRFE
jgi:hypothetical protein